MMYQSRMYRYNEYRVTDDSLQVCNSSDPLIKQRWRDLIAREKEVLASKHCNASVDAFYYSNYTLYRNVTVFFIPTEQSFTRQDYGVTFGYFAICSAKLSLSCNDYLVKVKYGDQYNVLQNFSRFTNNKMYDYREYQFGMLMYMAFKVVFCCTLLECLSSLLIEFAKNSRQAGTLHRNQMLLSVVNLSYCSSCQPLQP